jgi:hypothetical protein
MKDAVESFDAWMMREQMRNDPYDTPEEWIYHGPVDGTVPADPIAVPADPAEEDESDDETIGEELSLEDKGMR